MSTRCTPRCRAAHSTTRAPTTSRNRLKNGYLNIYGPQDPDQFPLPPGYYYGPLDGPEESISGEFDSDSQGAKDGLGRWQQTLGLPVTKKWDDGKTPKAATALQQQKGWEPNPLFGRRSLRRRMGRRSSATVGGCPPTGIPTTMPDPIPLITKWGDYSQYQKAYVDDTYPYRVICFRASVADNTFRDPGSPTGYAGTDTKWLENMRRARDMVARGRLDKIIAYHFWVPGADNWGAFQQALDDAGGLFPELACMLDVEDGGDKWMVARRPDTRRQGLGQATPRTTSRTSRQCRIYLNFRSNASLLVGITDIELRGCKLIVPGYHDPPPYTPPGIVPFGHQYTDKENTPPFGSTDMNQTNLTLPSYLEAWGVNGGAAPAPQPEPELPPTTETGLELICRSSSWPERRTSWRKHRSARSEPDETTGNKVKPTTKAQLARRARIRATATKARAQQPEAQNHPSRSRNNGPHPACHRPRRHRTRQHGLRRSRHRALRSETQGLRLRVRRQLRRALPAGRVAESPSIVMYDDDHNLLGHPGRHHRHHLLGQPPPSHPLRAQRERHLHDPAVRLDPDRRRCGRWPRWSSAWAVSATSCAPCSGSPATWSTGTRPNPMCASTIRGHPGNVMLTFDRIGDYVYIFGTGGLARNKPIWLWRSKADEFPHGYWEPWGLDDVAAGRGATPTSTRRSCPAATASCASATSRATAC